MRVGLIDGLGLLARLAGELAGQAGVVARAGWAGRRGGWLVGLMAHVPCDKAKVMLQNLDPSYTEALRCSRGALTSLRGAHVTVCRTAGALCTKALSM